jgi:hypothetical protein
MDEPRIEPESDAENPGIGDYYAGVCLVALVLMAVSLDRVLSARSGFLPVIPLAIGAVAVLFRLTSGPPIILILVTGLVITKAPRDMSHVMTGQPFVVARTTLFQLMLAASALAFTVAFYRRIALESGIFPPDRRRAPATKPGSKPEPLPAPRRAARLSTPAELVWLLIILSICTATGFFLWLALDRIPPPNDLLLDEDRVQWRLLVVAYLIVLCGACGSVLIGYVARARATPTQNMLYLHDQLWRETRIEQDRANRWLVWARSREQRRKEKS